MTKILISTLFLSITSLLCNAQVNYLQAFSTEEIKLSHTAIDVKTYTEEEKNTILYINLARIAPEKFEKFILQEYIKNNKIKPNIYTKSLSATLLKTKSLHALTPHEALDKHAITHATESGKKDKFGHDGFEKRAKELSQTFITVAENCDYGSSIGIDIAMSLLIDEGVKDYGHRKNLLNPEYFFIGISIKPHKSFEVNCVQLLGGKLK